MRLLICGGRDFNDYELLKDEVSKLERVNFIELIISGLARGADSLAQKWALEQGIAFMGFPADWKNHGRSAGFIRNKKMLEEGRPDLVLAFPGGAGTHNMVTIARKAGVPVELVQQQLELDL